MTVYKVENLSGSTIRKNGDPFSPIVTSMPIETLKINEGFLVPTSTASPNYVAKIVSRQNDREKRKSSLKRFVSRSGEGGTYIIRTC